MAARQLSDARTDGQKLGQSSTDLLGFWGATPVDRPATIADATNTTTTTTTTTALTTDIDSLRTKFNALLASLEEIGILASS